MPVQKLCRYLLGMPQEQDHTDTHVYILGLIVHSTVSKLHVQQRSWKRCSWMTLIQSIQNLKLRCSSAREKLKKSLARVIKLSAASSKGPAKKHSKREHSKKAEKKLLLQRIRGVTMVFQISCRLNQTILSDLESEPGKTEDGDSNKPSESAATVT